MKLPPFRMHRPTSLGEAVELRAQLGDDAAFYCGGTELLLVMKMGLTDLSDLIDVKGLAGLSSISAVAGAIRIGATATHSEIERHPLVRDRVPALSSMIRGIANVRVRSVGTLGGNLAFADPASDPATFFTAVGASLEIRGADGLQRTMPIADLGAGAYQTTLAEDELIEAVLVPVTRAGEVIVHQRMKFQERPAITVTVSVLVESDEVVEARIAVGAVAPVPGRIVLAEEELRGAVGASLDSAAELAGDAAASCVQLLDDTAEDQEYKRQLTRVLVARAAAQAMGSALAL